MYLHNGQLKNGPLMIPGDDLGFCRGYAVFDWARTYGGKIFHLSDHWLRLADSCSEVGLKLPATLEELADQISQLLTISAPTAVERGVKTIVTGGRSLDGFSPPELAEIYISAAPLPPLRSGPLHVVTTELQRSTPRAKTLFYLPALMALQRRSDPSATEILYQTESGELLEGSRSNLFLLTTEGELIASSSSEILPGITQHVLSHLATEILPVVRRPIYKEELQNASGVFLTSTTQEITPIAMVNNKTVGTAQGLSMVAELQRLYRAYTESPERWDKLPSWVPHRKESHAICSASPQSVSRQSSCSLEELL